MGLMRKEVSREQIRNLRAAKYKRMYGENWQAKLEEMYGPKWEEALDERRKRRSASKKTLSKAALLALISNRIASADTGTKAFIDLADQYAKLKGWSGLNAEKPKGRPKMPNEDILELEESL